MPFPSSVAAINTCSRMFVTSSKVMSIGDGHFPCGSGARMLVRNQGIVVKKKKGRLCLCQFRDGNKYGKLEL